MTRLALAPPTTILRKFAYRSARKQIGRDIAGISLWIEDALIHLACFDAGQQRRDLGVEMIGKSARHVVMQGACLGHTVSMKAQKLFSTGQTN